MESTLVPLPSEVVIPIAVHHAKASGRMTLLGIVLAGAVGSWAGATIMYWGARLAGRPLVLRYGCGCFFLIPEAKVNAAESPRLVLSGPVHSGFLPRDCCLLFAI